MKIVATALMSATALAVMAPVASAQSYAECQSDREDRQVAGAIIGGLLGAVIGNELADDDNNNRNRHYRGHRGSRHHGYRGRGHGSPRRHHNNNDDDAAATLAGAGVGALIGAGLASGDDCEQYRYNQQRYDDRYDDRRYQDSRYRNDDYGYEDGYGSRSDVYLEGGRNSQQSARTYQAGYQWTCEYRSSPQYDQYGQMRYVDVYMCQGQDGIWRPYEAYADY